MKVGLIGCGRMGRALAEGAMEAGAVQASDLTAYDVQPAAVESLATGHGIRPASTLRDLVDQSEVLLLCTKPGDVPAILEEVASFGSPATQPLLLSIAAGITLKTLETHLSGHARVIRAMPNTPALIGKGAAAFSRGPSATSEDAETARCLLASVGAVVEVKEHLMDAVTGLSGSGPAYIYVLIEALADGGVKNGLPRDTALELAAQTVRGAAEMVLATGQHPAALKDMVASPGGTTIAGLSALEASGFRAACIDAVTDATTRSRELGAE